MKSKTFSVIKHRVWTASDIKSLRKRYGITQQDLADLLGTKQTSVCRLESEDYHHSTGTDVMLDAAEQELKRRPAKNSERRVSISKTVAP